jgi:hypothetical protein
VSILENMHKTIQSLVLENNAGDIKHHEASSNTKSKGIGNPRKNGPYPQSKSKRCKHSPPL